MQRIKNISKLSFLILMMVAGIVTFSSVAQASIFKPYEYTFEANNNNKFFNISGVKDLQITFDNPINATEGNIYNNIFVVQQAVSEEGIYVETQALNIVENVRVAGNQLTVTFKNLEYIDYADPSEMDYVLVIKKGAGLHFDQLTDYIFPFKIHDILPGFQSVFLDSTQAAIDNLNKTILPENPYRDITVHVPKFSMTKIETIHRYEGVATDYNNEGNPNFGIKGPSLTNIDVFTDPTVARLKVNFPEVDDARFLDRDLEPHATVQGFTMGQAGIDGQGAEEAREFTLKAYDQYGRLLEVGNKKIKDLSLQLGENDRNKPVKYSGYISKVPSEFGKAFTMYNLMSNTKAFENILTTLSVDALNNLGVTYANQFTTVTVYNDEQLQMALENEKIETIILGDNFESNFSIKRNVTIDGNGNTVTGNVEIGEGNDITVRLIGLTIDGDTITDVGDNGVLIKEDVTMNDEYTIQSAGQKSIHVSKFSAKEIRFINTSPVRVVNEDTEPIDPSKVPNIILDTNAEVILEGGVYGTVTSNSDNANLTVKLGTTIEELVINGAKLTLTRPDSFELPPGVGLSKLEQKDSGETEPGEGNSGEGSTIGGLELNYKWDTDTAIGEEIDFTQLVVEKEILESINSWTVDDSNTQISIKNNKTLVITGLVEGDKGKEYKLTLIGSDESGKKYNVKLTVKIN